MEVQGLSVVVWNANLFHMVTVRWERNATLSEWLV